jgi:hypoxanthine phosphoribosyltransferase
MRSKTAIKVGAEVPMPDKHFVRPGDLVRDAFRLARKIFDSGYRPSVILVLWRGGTPVGVVVHEFLLYKGIDTYHTAVKAESYTGIGKRRTPRIEHFERVLDRIEPDSNVLIVDDIFDTGRTVRRVREMLRRKTRHVKIATLYYKPDSNTTDLVPDFFLRKTDRWIVFPHELLGLTPQEIRRKDPALAALVLDAPGDTHEC